MPKLILFAASEKVLLDKNSNSTTLVGLLEEVHFKFPPGATPPPNVALPMQWATLSLWQEEPSDAGIDFEQRITVENVNSQVLIDNISKFRFDQKRQRTITNVVGLPYSRRLTINLFLRAAGIPDWGRPIGSYPIEIVQDVL